MLWEGSLVMIDEETESLWSHILGQAMRGPLEGARLKPIPSVITDWGSWRARHPESTVVVMSQTAFEYVRDFYHPKIPLLLGIADEDDARAWPLPELFHQPIVNDSFGDRTVLVTFDPDSGTAVLFERTLGDRELTFDLQDDKLIDRETGTEWDRLTGVALTPPLEGTRLTQLPAIVSAFDAWSRFHPETSAWMFDQQD